VAACDLLKQHGAEEIWVMATHAVFSPPQSRGSSRAHQSGHRDDTLPLGPEKRFEKLEILSIAPILANASRHLRRHLRVRHFGGENLL